MDVFAHALWAAAAARAGKEKAAPEIRLRWAAAFGVFPDLFAFALPVVAAFPHHPDHGLAWRLYQLSHSLFVFAAAFGLVWWFRGRPLYEMLGWLLHILIDIPSHTTAFFPTPFLWPVAHYYVNGISWANRVFMLVNYSAIALAYMAWGLWIAQRSRREKRRRASVNAAMR